MKHLKLYEDNLSTGFTTGDIFDDWDFDEEEESSSTDPSSINYDFNNVIIKINDNLKQYNKNNGWNMDYMINREYNVDRTITINCIGLDGIQEKVDCFFFQHGGRYYIPFDAADIISVTPKSVTEDIDWDEDWDEDETPDTSSLIGNIPEDLTQVALGKYLGCTVKIREDSEYYRIGLNGDRSNPVDITGSIVNVDTDNKEYCFNVEWDNDIDNEYRRSDLEVIAGTVNENIDWDEDWDEDETPDDIINPYELKLPIDLLVNDKLREYISINSWPSDMYEFIGKTCKVMEISSLMYRNYSSVDRFERNCYHVAYGSDRYPRWWIPFDCMDLP